MTGRELLNKLSSLPPDQLDFDVVVEGDDSWLYGANDVRIIFEQWGRQREAGGGSPVIAITNNM